MGRTWRMKNPASPSKKGMEKPYSLLGDEDKPHKK
jgi:hypothetical protein